MTLSLFNLDAVITPTTAKRATSQDRDNAKLIRQSIGNPDNLNQTQYDKAIYCALRLDVSVEGMASRFVARHYSFLRYWSPIRSWVFSTKNDSGKTEWRSVPESHVWKLLQHQIKNMDKELKYAMAAADLGVIPTRRVKELNALPHLINAVLSSQPDLNAIYDAAKFRLNQNYQAAGEPITPESAQSAPRDPAKKPLGRPRGKKTKDAVLCFGEVS